MWAWPVVSVKNTLFYRQYSSLNFLCMMPHAICTSINALFKPNFLNTVQRNFVVSFFGIPWIIITTNYKRVQHYLKNKGWLLVTHMFTLKSNTHPIIRELVIIDLSHNISHGLIISIRSYNNWHINRFWSLTQPNHQHFTFQYLSSIFFLLSLLRPMLIFPLLSWIEMHWVGME